MRAALLVGIWLTPPILISFHQLYQYKEIFLLALERF